MKTYKVNVTIDELETEWRDPLTSTLIVLGFYLVSGFFAIITSCLASWRGIELVGKLGKYEIKLEDTMKSDRNKKNLNKGFALANTVAKFKRRDTVSLYYPCSVTIFSYFVGFRL